MSQSTSANGRPEWSPVYTPFDADLHDVVQASTGPYAVGANGIVAANTTGEWATVVSDGPAAQSRTLRAAATTDDGDRVWFVGASGAVGAYDVRGGQKHDYSDANHGVTTSWRAVAVAGATGQEHGYVANGSGDVVPFTVDGGTVTWKDPVEPGSGATVTALAAASDGVVYAIDAQGKAYKSTVGSGSWNQIGTLNAQVVFNDIYAGPKGRVFVAAGDGRLYRYDPKNQNWTPTTVANAALKAVDLFQDRLVTIAANNTIHARDMADGAHWEHTTAPVGHDLTALALGYPDVAVGTAGTVIHRGPMHPPKKSKSKPKSKPKAKDPKKKQQPKERLLTCETIVEELLTRLERDELVRLLELRENCDPMLLEHLETMEDESHVELDALLEGREILPLLLDAGATASAEEEYVRVPRDAVEAGTRGGRAEELDVATLLERLRC